MQAQEVHSRHFSYSSYQKLPATLKRRLLRHGKGDKAKLQGHGDYSLRYGAE